MALTQNQTELARLFCLELEELFHGNSTRGVRSQDRADLTFEMHEGRRSPSAWINATPPGDLCPTLVFTPSREIVTAQLKQMYEHVLHWESVAWRLSQGSRRPESFRFDVQFMPSSPQSVVIRVLRHPRTVDLIELDTVTARSFWDRLNEDEL